MNIAVIQARMSSKRLPGKALMLIDSNPLIYHVVRRGEKIRGINKVILATSQNRENDKLVDYVSSMGIEVFRGDEDNVLERFYVTARKHSAENIVRLTGDNPLLDFNVLSLLLSKHSKNKSDYSCITGFPIGAVGDIFSFKALDVSYENVDGKQLCDHIDLYVLENQEKFKIACYKLLDSFPVYRWTVDEQRDIDVIREFFLSVEENTGRKIQDMDTKSLVELVKSLGFNERMQPLGVNISERNLYSAELVKKINSVPVYYEEFYDVSGN